MNKELKVLFTKWVDNKLVAYMSDYTTMILIG